MCSLPTYTVLIHSCFKWLYQCSISGFVVFNCFFPPIFTSTNCLIIKVGGNTNSIPLWPQSSPQKTNWIYKISSFCKSLWRTKYGFKRKNKKNAQKWKHYISWKIVNVYNISITKPKKRRKHFSSFFRTKQKPNFPFPYPDN